MRIRSKRGRDKFIDKINQSLEDTITFMENIRDEPKQIPLAFDPPSEGDGFAVEAKPEVAKLVPKTVIRSTRGKARKMNEYRKRALAVSNMLSKNGRGGLNVIELFALTSLLRSRDT